MTMSSVFDGRMDERPREKLVARGVASLSDYELLMAIIGSGNAQADVTKIARELLKILRKNHDLTLDSVRAVSSWSGGCGTVL